MLRWRMRYGECEGSYQPTDRAELRVWEHEANGEGGANGGIGFEWHSGLPDMDSDHWSCDLQRWYCTISRFSVCHLRELAGPALYDIFIRRIKNTSDITTFYRLESNKAKNLVQRKSDISTNEPSTLPSCLRTPSHAINQETSRITFPPYISTYHSS